LEVTGLTSDVETMELDTFTRNSDTSYRRPDDESDIFPGNRSEPVRKRRKYAISYTEF
jgi:hypothetical protein